MRGEVILQFPQPSITLQNIIVPDTLAMNGMNLLQYYVQLPCNVNLSKHIGYWVVGSLDGRAGGKTLESGPNARDINGNGSRVTVDIAHIIFCKCQLKRKTTYPWTEQRPISDDAFRLEKEICLDSYLGRGGIPFALLV